jgi:hypothetical protein
MAGILQLYEQEAQDSKELDCVEIYMPKSLKHLSELYGFLRSKVTERLGELVLDGFSIYEVDGVFSGKKLWEERSLVIRILFIRPAASPARSVQAKIKDLGRAIANTVATKEEEIWICHYPQTVTVFRPNTKILT